jgi:prevent-host-death family protein
LRHTPQYDYNDHHDHWGAAYMNSQTWTVAQAKAKFSEVIDRAMSEGPQTITRKGRTAVVVVDAQEWQRKTKRVGTLAEFFARSPLREGGLKLPRRTRPRRIDL